MKFSFGGLSRTAHGTVELKQSQHISRAEFDGMGWVISVPASAARRRYKEVLYLPQTPDGAVRAQAGIRYEDQGKVLVREGDVRPGEVKLGGLWALLPTDPPGKYRLTIFIDGMPVQSTNFLVAD